MPDDIIPPRKPARRKRTTPTAPGEARPLRRKRIRETPEEQRISQDLTALYRDADGTLPNMNEIKLRRGGSLWRLLRVLIVMTVLIGGALWAGLVLLPSQGDNFAESRVELRVSGPSAVRFGETVNYTIAYANNQATPLTNALLQIRYPAGFSFATSSQQFSNTGHTELDLHTIQPRAKGAITIQGTMFSPLQQAQSWRLALSYRPEGVVSSFLKTASLAVTVSDSPLDIIVSGPASVPVGQEAEWSAQLVLKGTVPPLAGLELVPVVPEYFSITSSSPILTTSKRWKISPALLASSTPAASSVAPFRLRGRFTNTQEKQAIAFQLVMPPGADGAPTVIAEKSITPALVANTLSVDLAVNGGVTDGAIRPGELLTITMRLKNNAATALTNAVVRLTINAPSITKQSILNWPAIEDKADGDIQGEQLSASLRHGQITWDKKKIPALAKLDPGKEVLVDISLPVRTHEQLDFADLAEHALVIAAQATATGSAATKETANAGPISMSLNSDLALEVRSEAPSKEAGEEKFPLTWVLTNHLHPLKNITLNATVYGKAAVSANTPTPAGTAVFDSKNQTITWAIAEMPESVDVLAWPFTVTLAGRNPTQNTLVSKVKVAAEDTVTGQRIEFTGDEVTLPTN